MNRKIKIVFKNQIFEYDEGITYKQISDDFKKYYNYDILVAQIDNNIVDLSDKLTKKCTIEFFDRSSTTGNSIYARSARFMLTLAVRNVLGEDAEIIFENSIDKGIYCSIEGSEISENIVKELYEEMKNISSKNYKFNKLSVSRIDAIKYFKKLNRIDKANVLKYISNTYVNLYKISDMYDYYYGKMAYSTNQIDDFKLTYIKDNGFVLSLPDIINPECTLDYTHHQMIFDKFLSYTNWGKLLGISNAADLNRVVSKAEIGDLINLAEAHYDSQLSSIAEEIYKSNRNIKIVLLAGPSSSGKTTTSKKLSIYLRSKGFITHPIALDDYFLEYENRILDENGNPDFESIRALDIELFNKHLTQLLEGKKVSLPTYNFVLG